MRFAEFARQLYGRKLTTMEIRSAKGRAKWSNTLEHLIAGSRGKKLHPQYYAMTFLDLGTGLRPSSLRPLRRNGELADVLWDKGRLLVRRSQTLGTEVMKTTKQRVLYRIHLRDPVHVETQLHTPEMRQTAATGGFGAPCVLNKPFADVRTPSASARDSRRGLRRTFNDLYRAATIESVVTSRAVGLRGCSPLVLRP